MIESIFYILSFLGAVIGLTLCPKEEKKINFVVGIMFSYISVLCVGSVGAFGLNLAGIPLNLWSMGGMYVVIALVAVFVCVKKKKVQKVCLRGIDILAAVVCVAVVGLIALHIYTPYIHLNYNNAIDPSNHYMWAMQVSRNENLSGMFFAPLYNGMIINLFKWFLPVSWTYKAFIIADIYHTIVALLFFYAIAVVLLEHNKRKWLPLFVSLLYWCGYPLFSFGVGGYVYWGMSVMLVEYVFMMLKFYAEKKELRKAAIVAAFIGCFAVSVCYIQFAPGIFFTLFGVYIYNGVVEKRIHFKVNKKTIGIALCGCVAAGICAFIGYQMIFASRGIKLFEAFKLGSMSTNSLEILLFCPVITAIMVDIYKRKERWNSFHIGVFCYGGLQVVMTLLSAIGIISTYYLFKNYIVLWFLVFAILLEQKRSLSVEMRKRLITYAVGMTCFLSLSYDGEESDAVSLKHSIWVTNINFFRETDFAEGYMSDNGKLYLMQYAMEEMGEKKVPLVVSNERMGAVSWYKGLYAEGSGFVYSHWTQEAIEKKLDAAEVQYFMVFFDDLLYREQLHDYLDTFERVYQNEDGFIAKRY